MNPSCCLPLITAAYFLSNTINCADLQNQIASINPQLPVFQSQPTLPLNSIDFPLKVSDGTEINPNYNGNLWKTDNFASPTKTKIYSNDTSKAANSSDNTSSWFPDLSGTPEGDNNITHTFANNRSTSDNTKDTSSSPAERLQKELSKINWRYFYASEAEKQRDFSIISLAFELLNSRSQNTAASPLNILHIGTDSGYIPLAMAILDSNEDDFTLSLSDSSGTKDQAKQNVIRAGKENFLTSGKLKFETVYNLAKSPLPKSRNGQPFDLIILSKSVDKSAPLPANIRDALSLRGMLIYPERDASTGQKRIMLDRSNDSGSLNNIKSINQ